MSLNRQPFGWARYTAKVTRSVTLHGTADTLASITETKELVGAIQSAGGPSV